MRMRSVGIVIAVLVGFFGLHDFAAAQQAQLRCEVAENGKPALGRMQLTGSKGGSQQKVCGSTMRVAPGKYRVVVMLEGVIGEARTEKNITLTAGDDETLSEDFAVGTVTLRVSKDGRRVAARAEIFSKDGSKGHLASGSKATIVAGDYSVQIVYRGQNKDQKLRVEPGQVQTLDIDFD